MSALPHRCQSLAQGLRPLETRLLVVAGQMTIRIVCVRKVDNEFAYHSGMAAREEITLASWRLAGGKRAGLTVLRKQDRYAMKVASGHAELRRERIIDTQLSMAKLEREAAMEDRSSERAIVIGSTYQARRACPSCCPEVDADKQIVMILAKQFSSYISACPVLTLPFLGLK